ncbi:unnamed protein product [Rhizoctonia solani]|uniref:Uncharacterized protein n=1 Tax=Rhizoctonia solani TaxID=456999 RepID=A0A8H2W8T0_9AGAM|nr:unnamed protein product [Rhizoctonia solani]CAE6510937.1 unnamed protein product [Rhizoctonia solani]
MSLRPGPYLARFIGEGDPGFIGGMYATDKGPGRPIGLDPDAPQFRGQQEWLFIPSNEGPDVYIIKSKNDEYWSYRSEPPAPEESVILGDLRPFRVQHSEGVQGEHIFTIAPTRQPIGATFYVGAGQGRRELILVPIPVIPGAPPAPLWELKPLEE